jgi:hypothetical protein
MLSFSLGLRKPSEKHSFLTLTQFFDAKTQFSGRMDGTISFALLFCVRIKCSFLIEKEKTGQSHHFWGCVFCGVVTQLFLVRVLRKFALGLFFATLLLL